MHNVQLLTEPAFDPPDQGSELVSQGSERVSQGSELEARTPEDSRKGSVSLWLTLAKSRLATWVICQRLIPLIRAASESVRAAS
jgi:hypothetical protein